MTQLPVTRTMRDRRQRRRILTMRNTTVAAAIAVAVFITISIASELRSTTPGEYGRLYEQRTARAVDAAPEPTVITEAPISDQVAADPLLIATQRKEELLEGELLPYDARARAAMANEGTQAFTSFTPERKLQLRGQPGEGSRFKITGGAGGVYTVVEE